MWRHPRRGRQMGYTTCTHGGNTPTIRRSEHALISQGVQLSKLHTCKQPCAYIGICASSASILVAQCRRPQVGNHHQTCLPGRAGRAVSHGTASEKPNKATRHTAPGRASVLSLALAGSMGGGYLYLSISLSASHCARDPIQQIPPAEPARSRSATGQTDRRTGARAHSSATERAHISSSPHPLTTAQSHPASALWPQPSDEAKRRRVRQLAARGAAMRTCARAARTRALRAGTGQAARPGRAGA